MASRAPCRTQSGTGGGVMSEDDLTIPPAFDRRGELSAKRGDDTVKTQSTWRDHLPVHPAADLFPLMSEPELRELGEDIKKNGGLISPITFVQVGDHFELLD